MPAMKKATNYLEKSDKDDVMVPKNGGLACVPTCECVCVEQREREREGEEHV